MATSSASDSIREHPAEWALGVLLTLFFAAVLSEFLGWWGVLAALPVGALFAYWLHRYHSRYPLWRLPEIGPIEMELLRSRPNGTLTGTWLRRMNVAAGVMFLIGFCLYAVSELSDVPPDRMPAAFAHLGRRFVEIVGYCAMNRASLNNSTWPLLVAGEGVFRLTDPTRLWVTNPDVRDPNTRLRAVRIYGWEQIAQFHFSGRPHAYKLHLSVRYPNMAVPQLISYELPPLSESERERLEGVLRTHVPAAATAPAREPIAV
jgi:hypothetical protein